MVDVDVADPKLRLQRGDDEVDNRVVVDDGVRGRGDVFFVGPLRVRNVVLLGSVLERLLGHLEERQHVDRAVDDLGAIDVWVGLVQWPR